MVGEEREKESESAERDIVTSKYKKGLYRSQLLKQLFKDWLQVRHFLPSVFKCFLCHDLYSISVGSNVWYTGSLPFPLSMVFSFFHVFFSSSFAFTAAFLRKVRYTQRRQATQRRSHKASARRIAVDSSANWVCDCRSVISRCTTSPGPCYLDFLSHPAAAFYVYLWVSVSTIVFLPSQVTIKYILLNNSLLGTDSVKVLARKC